MEESEARQRLDEYGRRERRLRRRLTEPLMTFFATFAFVYLVGSSLKSWQVYGMAAAVFAGWGFYSSRRGEVSLTSAQNRKLYAMLFVGWCWIMACHAYFVNWNPRRIPHSGLVGGIVAAVPFLVLAYWYRE